MNMKKRKKSSEDNLIDSKKQKGLDNCTITNVFNDWNTEITSITDKTQEILSKRAEHIYEGIGRELESIVFEYTKNEEEYFLSLLKDSNIESNINFIIDYLQKYKNLINLNQINNHHNHVHANNGINNNNNNNEKISIEKLEKQLIKCSSKLSSQNIIKDKEFIIKNWSYFLPILLSNSIHDSEISIIIDKIPILIKFIIKSIRKFQLNNIKNNYIQDLETINLYKNVLQNYEKMNDLFININNITANNQVINLMDPLTIYIKKVLNFTSSTKISSSFIPFKYNENNHLISKYKLDTSLLDNNNNVIYLLYGNNITSLGVFGSNFLKKKMNLDNLWYLKIFTNNLKELRLNNKNEKNDINEDIESEKLDNFIGTLGYGINSFDSLVSMNPRPELYKRENNNYLRWIIGKKVYKKYIKDMDSSKTKSFFCKTPLIIKNLFIEDNKFGTKDFPEFPSMPNKEPLCNSINYFDNNLKKQYNYPLGFISSIKLDHQNKKELELIILDIKECSNYNKNDNLKAFRFTEYGLFWQNDQSSKESCIDFKLLLLRTCNASINYSIKFKSHLYYTRFLLEQIINSNWKKRLITKNKKYYKLSSLVNGGFLNKSQKENINKITKVITNNCLWENYCDIIPRILTGTDKKINNNDLNEWEYFDEKDEFDKELNKISKSNLNSNSTNSSEFYNKYLKFNKKNYKSISKKCQKLLAKYIFKEYPKFLTNYYKIRKEWKEFNTNENLKRNKQNVNNSSRLQLDIIGYSGDKNIKAQFSNFQNLNIKHDPNEINPQLQDPQIEHLIKIEKKETNNFLTVLPNFDQSLPLNKIYKLKQFISEDIFSHIKIEWNKNAINTNNECYNSFVKNLFRYLVNNSIFNNEYKLFFLRIIHIINWLIYLLNNSNKSFGGSRAIQKCLNSYFEKESNTNKIQIYNKIPMEFCNWTIDNFMSKYQTDNLQTRFSFSSTGESKLFVTILWLSNYVVSHCNNLNYNDYKGDYFVIPEYLPTEPVPIEFSDLLIQDLRDKFTKKFRSLSHALGFRSTTPPPRNFKSKNYSIPPNVTSVILNEYPRLSTK